MIDVGTQAPEIDLETQFGTRWKLSDRKNRKNVLILFYPMDWTPICSSELPEANQLLPQFSAADTEVVACNTDTKPSHQRWSESIGPIGFPMLCDVWPKGAIAAQYGAFLSDRGICDRASVLIGKDGSVKYVESVGVDGRRDFGQLLKVAQDVNQGIAPAECSISKGVLRSGVQYSQGTPARTACEIEPEWVPLINEPVPVNSIEQKPVRIKAAAFPIQVADATLYYSRGCHHCHKVIQFLDRRRGTAVIVRKEISEPGVLVELRSITRMHSVPTLILKDGTTIVGKDQVMTKIGELLPIQK